MFIINFFWSNFAFRQKHHSFHLQFPNLHHHPWKKGKILLLPRHVKLTFLLTHPGREHFSSFTRAFVFLVRSIFFMVHHSFCHLTFHFKSLRTAFSQALTTWPERLSRTKGKVNEWNEMNWWTSQRVYTFSLPFLLRFLQVSSCWSENF